MVIDLEARLVHTQNHELTSTHSWHGLFRVVVGKAHGHDIGKALYSAAYL